MATKTKETNTDKAGNMAPVQSLAPVQRDTLEFLRNYITNKGYAPTLKDICTHIGAKSPSTAFFHLSRLEEKGFIVRGDDGSFELSNKKDFSNPAGASLGANGNFSVPLLGLIAAGRPIEAIEDSSVLIDVPPQYFDTRYEIFCLQVTGESMIDAHIMDGDIVIIRKQPTADDGQIVVAVLEDGSATLKTFRRLKGGKVMLLPQNPTMAPITVDGVDIKGRVIGLLREF